MTTDAAIRDRIVALRRMPAGDLVPNRKNARRHPDLQRDILKDLLTEIGYADALIAYPDGDRLVLIDGHLRQDLDPDQVVPVLEVDLSPEEADLLLATLDPLASLARSDPEAVALLHADVATSSDLVLGFLTAIENAAGAPLVSGGIGPDELPLEIAARARPGDIWQLGEHRVVCGDATDAATWKSLGVERIDAVWTDPPYGVGYTGKTKDALKISHDAAEQVGGLLHKTYAMLDAYLARGAAIYVAHPTTGELGLMFLESFHDQGWTICQELVWVKDRMVLGHADYHFRHEPITYGRKPGTGRRGRGRAGWYAGNAEASVFEIARPSASPEHPTAKPVELVRRCLQNSSARGDVIADPFLGSGTTLIASHQLARRFVGIEIDPRYVDVALGRWEAFTDQKAKRL
jgi:DNA modification methylase